MTLSVCDLGTLKSTPVAKPEAFFLIQYYLYSIFRSPADCQLNSPELPCKPFYTKLIFIGIVPSKHKSNTIIITLNHVSGFKNCSEMSVERLQASYYFI